MYLKQILILLISLHFLPHAFSQSKTAALNGDCLHAVEIIPEGNFVFKKSPNGYGETLEFKNNPSNSLYYFQEENNTAWFTFTASESGTLVFKIQPKNIEADFDFLLFEYTNNKFCNNISNRSIKPIRSNISRNDTASKSMTGLSSNSAEEFVKSGIGNPWSKMLSFKKGERYYLVINKANNIETPFRILFKSEYELSDSTTVTGVLKDDKTGTVIKGAHVTIEQTSGKIMGETLSDHITGEFIITIPLEPKNNSRKYILSGIKDEYFFIEKTIFISSKTNLKPLNLVLSKLKKGKNLTLHNINFAGNKATTLPSSERSLHRLYQLMNKNKTLRIKIEGHTNGCTNGKLQAQHLSEERAKTIRTYLISKGISKNRISTVGFGCSKLLFPINSSAEKQSQNRRVEIFVVEY